MKLLLYSHFFAPSVGGVETSVRILASGIAELTGKDNNPQFRVTVVTETPAGDVDDRPLPFNVIRQPGIIQLWSLIRTADVVHLAGPSMVPLFLGWLARKPVVVEHHGYQAICPNGVLIHQPDGSVCSGFFQARQYGECVKCQAAEMSWLRSFAKLFMMFPRYFLTRAASHNIAITKHVLERHKLPRASVIYYGVEEVPEVEPPSRPHSFPPEKLCFAYVGRLVPEKGLFLLLQAAEILKNEGASFEVLFVGDGPQRLQLQAMIQEKGLLEVARITGFLSRDALAKQLSQVRVVVMPSVWEETAGLAAIEQMIRGQLVIASEIGGLGEVVGDAGFKFKPGDVEDLTGCMRRVLRDPSKITAMGAKARRRAQEVFLLKRMVAEHAALYEKLSRD